MPSNLQGIIDGITANLATVAALKTVVQYKPDTVPTQIPMLYVSGLHLDYPETTYGEMTIGWTITAFLVLAPIAAKASAAEGMLYGLVPQIIEVMGHDLDAGGALADGTGSGSDGQVLVTDADEGEAVIGGSKWYALRLRFRVTERFSYQYAN